MVIRVLVDDLSTDLLVKESGVFVDDVLGSFWSVCFCVVMCFVDFSVPAVVRE